MSDNNSHIDYLNWTVDYNIDFDGSFVFTNHTDPAYKGHAVEHKIPAAVVRDLMIKLLRARRIKVIEHAFPNEILDG